MAGYALKVGPRGSKLKESTGPVKGDPDDPRKGGFQGEIEARIAAGVSVAGSRGIRTTDKEIRWLADTLSGLLEKPVADETGLTGRYDFSLQFTADQAPRATAPEAGPPSDGIAQDPPLFPAIFQALQGQLGLKLESKKIPVEILVVDQAKRTPTEN